MLTFLGGGRGCAGALTRPSTRHLLPKNFEKTALRKRVGIFTVKMRGGHIYGNYCILEMLNTIFWQKKFEEIALKEVHMNLAYNGKFSRKAISRHLIV